MTKITEDHIEQLCRDRSCAQGYGPHFVQDGDVPGQQSYKQVVVSGPLIPSMQKINLHEFAEVVPC
ncbi:MAG: hypothetical protein IMY82_09050 [Chloroflexi bacterium]|nr:hypothetical protein [Chloroflexota bacterium]